MKFRTVKEYGKGRYSISECGKVFSTAYNRKIRTYVNTLGYEYVVFSDNGLKKKFYIHRLVAEAWISGRTNDKKYVNHKDLNRLNNHKDNLEWINHTDNLLHRKMGKKRGVHITANKGWRAQIHYKKTNIYLGTYSRKESAYEAYRVKYVELYGVEPW